MIRVCGNSLENLYLRIGQEKKLKMKYSSRDRCMIIHARQRNLPIHFTVLFEVVTYNKIITLCITVKVLSAFLGCYEAKRTNINEFLLTDEKHGKGKINHFNIGKALMLSHCQKGHKMLLINVQCTLLLMFISSIPL